MLINLVGNAFKFAVEDTGYGMDEATPGNLFRPFTQADSSTTRRFGGSGLGLMIAREMAHALGGNVVIALSAPGQGSTFVATIDSGPAESQSYDVVKPGSRKRSGYSLAGFRVLVIDDHRDIRSDGRRLP